MHCNRPFWLLLPLASLFIVSACNTQGPPPSPKPRAYPKVTYPSSKPLSFDASYCAFSFEYPSYATIQQDQYFFDGEPAHPCWFDLYIPDFDASLHCSYIPVGKDKSLEQLRKDAFEMADYHTKRANYIDEVRIDRKEEANVEGFAFAIEGPAATPFQFYLTDGDEHFFRASLYFSTEVRPDSLQPVYQFIRKDLIKMIETFEWADQPAS